MNQQHLYSEWALLQNQFDSYEKYSLIIKLINVTILAIAYFANSISLFILCLLLILWLQDAIWKTFQSRIETRLLTLETAIKNNHSDKESSTIAYQFNSEFEKNRKSIIGLIAEYCRQAIRPTIAFPHFLLVVLVSYLLFT